jgi:hypothetical protein
MIQSNNQVVTAVCQEQKPAEKYISGTIHPPKTSIHAQSCPSHVILIFLCRLVHHATPGLKSLLH